MIELKLNNQTALYISVLTIFQACLEKKVYIPRFCYHQSLKIAGNCRMCLVEEKSSIKPIVSCAISIAQGMSIYTQTELVKKAREGVIEYLLINHPLDCPICDQGGECDLQDQTVVFGADRGRFYENKRATQNKNFGFLVKSFLNRCIHCARCTRYINDLAGLDLGIIGRGFGSEVSTYINKFLKSEVSGNVIDLCPVGALTSKPYAFKARPWELVSVYTFDVVEPFASNIEINYRGLEVMRILPRINNEVNDEWISDKTRFYYDSFKVQRLVSPYLKRNGKIKNFSWLNTFNIWKNINFENKKFYLLLNKQQLNPVNYYIGNNIDLETVVALKYYLIQSSTTGWFSLNYDLRVFLYGNTDNQMFAAGLKPESIFIFIINVNPRLQSPVLNIKLRKIVMEKDVIIYFVGYLSNTNYDFQHLGMNLSKKIMLLKKIRAEDKANLLIISPEFENLRTVENKIKFCKIAASVGVLSLGELNMGASKNLGVSSNIQLFIGHPEKYSFLISKNLFYVNFLHHVEEVFWDNCNYYNGIKLPVKFYLEKVGSYFSESGYFFSTLTNIFGYSISGTKEDWKIILGFCELLNMQFLNKKKIELFQKLEYGRQSMFLLNKKKNNLISFFVEQPINFKKSVMNNYYQGDILSRLSTTLSLCSKKYVVYNDYKFDIEL